MNIKYLATVVNLILLFLPVSSGILSGILFANGWLGWPIFLAILSLFSTIIFGGFLINRREIQRVRETSEMQYGKIHFSE